MAVKSRNQKHRVLVLEGGKVKAKRVKIGPSNGTSTVILEGLTETDKVIASQVKRKGKKGGRSRQGGNSSMRNMRQMMRR